MFLRVPGAEVRSVTAVFSVDNFTTDKTSEMPGSRKKRDKKLECDKCKKFFRDNYAMQNHACNKVGVVCTICMKVLSNRDSLLRHLRKGTHKTIPTKKKREKKLQCDHCNCRFRDKYAIINHACLKSSVQCLDCDKVFCNRDSYRRHHRKIHVNGDAITSAAQSGNPPKRRRLLMMEHTSLGELDDDLERRRNRSDSGSYEESTESAESMYHFIFIYYKFLLFNEYFGTFTDLQPGLTWRESIRADSSGETRMANAPLPAAFNGIISGYRNTNTSHASALDGSERSQVVNKKRCSTASDSVILEADEGL